jgi:hypothetical protein
MKKLQFQRDNNQAIKKISCKFRLPCPAKLQYLDTLENLSLYSARQQVINLVKCKTEKVRRQGDILFYCIGVNCIE